MECILVFPLVDGVSYNNSRDFRWWMTKFFDALPKLCSLARRSIDDSIATFNASTMLVNQMVARSDFSEDVNETIRRFQQRLPIAFGRTLDLMRTIMQGNALMGLFSSNWEFDVVEKGQSTNATFLTVPVRHTDTARNTTCSCATLKTCSTPARLFDNGSVYYAFEGLVSGCHMLETILLSSFSCFYSITCINSSRHALLTLLHGEGDYTLPFFMKLDSSTSRFSTSATFETLAYEMFIESWTSNASYEQFFDSCAISSCRYTYYYRFDALELLVTFLSVFSSLSLGIRCLVPYTVRIYQRIRRAPTVMPFSS